jgi:electron transfer flavoprotein alpha subunit
MVRNLVIVEHDGHRLKQSSLNAVSLAHQLGGSFNFVVLGSGVEEIVESVRRFGAAHVFVADDPALCDPLADRYAVVIARLAREQEAANIMGTSSTFTKDVLPRVASLLDAPMVSDVMNMETVDGQAVFARPVNAGSLCATVKTDGEVCVFTVRGTAYPAPPTLDESSPVGAVTVEAESLPAGMRFVSRTKSDSTRPDLTEARVVVSGGRPLENKETFDRLIGGLADVLGGAVAATRATVDAGIAPNDYQVGQTGQSVAPELYIAVGVSGAIQHVAGVKDSRVIVAINRDPDAPIFQIANYGLVGDLYDIVPRLIEALRG